MCQGKCNSESKESSTLTNETNTPPRAAGPWPKATDEIHWKSGFSDMEFPPVPFPTRRVFAVAGEATIRALVHTHHDRLKQSPIGHLFPTDPTRFAIGVTKAADFIIEVTGGPNYYASAHEPICMRTRHFPFTIDERAREIWLAYLLIAFDEVGFPSEIREEYWNWVEAMSIRMINRRTMRAAPRRIPFADAAAMLNLNASNFLWREAQPA